MPSGGAGYFTGASMTVEHIALVLGSTTAIVTATSVLGPIGLRWIRTTAKAIAWIDKNGPRIVDMAENFGERINGHTLFQQIDVNTGILKDLKKWVESQTARTNTIEKNITEIHDRCIALHGKVALEIHAKPVLFELEAAKTVEENPKEP
jgi:hypothetical protein